jgi:hypothetical protein
MQDVVAWQDNTGAKDKVLTANESRQHGSRWRECFLSWCRRVVDSCATGYCRGAGFLIDIDPRLESSRGRHRHLRHVEREVYNTIYYEKYAYVECQPWRCTQLNRCRPE